MLVCNRNGTKSTLECGILHSKIPKNLDIRARALFTDSTPLGRGYHLPRDYTLMADPLLRPHLSLTTLSTGPRPPRDIDLVQSAANDKILFTAMYMYRVVQKTAQS